MRRKLFFLWLEGLVFLIVQTVCAQVMRTPAGSVEFLGLEKWTPAQIQQRLGYDSPDKLHYCAADLKKLGFPEVAVIGASENGHRDTVVTVVEPQRAAEIVYKPGPSQELALPREIADLTIITRQSEFLAGGILDYGRTLPGALTSIPWLSDGTAQSWWPTIRSLRRESDFHAAKQILEKSGNPDARAIAAIILMNFSSKDAVWYCLVSGLRDPNNLVQFACLQALNSLATYQPRRVNWSPASQDLISLLHGTDLFAFQVVLKALAVTHIEPTLATPLLSRGGARLVIAYLHAEHKDQRGLALTFLIQMRGRDLGTDPKVWENWVASLRG